MQDQEFLNWLLEASTPSIRYLTLRRLLRRPMTDDDVQEAWEAMKIHAPIPVILEQQTDSGSWAGENSFYTPKYTSTHWSMVLMAELSADGSDPHLKRGATYMLSQMKKGVLKWIDESDHGLSCFWGNMLRYVLHCGFEDDQRVASILEMIIQDAVKGAWRCPFNYELPCAWGAGRALWGLAALPVQLKNAEVEMAVQSGVALLLEKYSLVDANYPNPGRIHPLWFRMNFPLFYQTDILFVLRVLAELGIIDHPGAKPAVDWLRSRQMLNGHWRGANPFRGRTWKVLGSRDETNRWVSLHAAMVLDHIE
jgi:hypothetical protein